MNLDNMEECEANDLRGKYLTSGDWLFLIFKRLLEDLVDLLQLFLLESFAPEFTLRSNYGALARMAAS
jgi:hypothetical protein